MRHAWVLVLLTAAGCIDLKASYPERRFYTLDAPWAGLDRVPAPGSVLRVRRFNASKLCDGSELVTRTADSTYETDFYNVFFAPPAGQAGEQTQHWLTAAKLFGTVVGNGSSLAETHILEGKLVALHGDVRSADSPVAVIELQFLLLRVRSDPATVLFQKSYHESTPVLSGEPAAMVKGWSGGLAKILIALEEDLSKLKR